jgi:hypothetical protein
MTAGRQLGAPDLEQSTLALVEALSPVNVARTGPADKAFPPKKLCWKAAIGVTQITVWQYVP